MPRPFIYILSIMYMVSIGLGISKGNWTAAAGYFCALILLVYIAVKEDEDD